MRFLRRYGHKSHEFVRFLHRYGHKSYEFVWFLHRYGHKSYEFVWFLHRAPRGSTSGYTARSDSACATSEPDGAPSLPSSRIEFGSSHTVAFRSFFLAAQQCKCLHGCILSWSCLPIIIPGSSLSPVHLFNSIIKLILNVRGQFSHPYFHLPHHKLVSLKCAPNCGFPAGTTSEAVVCS